MKKLVIVQTALLLATILLGSLLKNDLASGVRDFHRAFGMLSVLSSILVLITTFKTNVQSQIKWLSFAVITLSIVAALGGLSLSTTSNYDLSYIQMAGSGFVAFIISCVLLYKLRSRKKK
jgi:heme A synthase